MRQFLAILWTFELLLHLDQLFSSNLVGINHAPVINRINYLSENILFLKNDKIVTEIYLKSLRTKIKKDKKVTHCLVKKIKRTISFNAKN